jgi:hypothetical protein
MKQWCSTTWKESCQTSALVNTARWQRSEVVTIKC